MAKLKQLSNTAAFYIGWYGTCENDGTEQCEPFELINDNDGVLSHAHDNIRDIKMVSSNREGLLGYSGAASSFFLKFQTIKRLECGKCYQITMKPGEGSLNIPEFTFANAQNDDPEQDLNNRITDRCIAPQPPAPTPNPTPTPAPSPFPTSTPGVTPRATPTPTATPNPCSPGQVQVNVGVDEIVKAETRFYSFPVEGGTICFSGATGGPPDNSAVRIDGQASLEGRMVVNGVLINNSITYIKKDGTRYTGTYKNNGPFTDLTK